MVPGYGYAAGMDLWITPKNRVTHNPTPAWTTLRVAHIFTTAAAAKDFYIKGILKPLVFSWKGGRPYPESLKTLKIVS